MTTVSQAEFAELLGCSRPYISKLIASGVLNLNADGRLDLEEAVASMKAASSPAHQAGAAPATTALMEEIRNFALGTGAADPLLLHDEAGTAPSFQQSRAQREFFAAKNERLK